MALTPEKKVKNKVVKLLKEYAAYYFFPATYGFGRSGVPDIIVCYRGHFIGVECKAGANTPLMPVSTAPGGGGILFCGLAVEKPPPTTRRF